MSTVTRTSLRESVPEVDWLTVVLLTMTMAFQVGGIFASTQLQAIETVELTQSSNASIGPAIVGILVAESLLIVAVWRVYKRLSRRWQLAVKYTLIAIFGVTAAAGLYDVLQTYPEAAYVFVPLLGLAVADNILARYDLDWVTFNVGVAALGIAYLGGAALKVAPVVVLPLLVLSLIWDHYAVNLSDIMGDLIDFSASVNLPSYLLIPSRLRVDYEDVNDYVKAAGDEDVDAERPDGLEAIIGLGDFFIPGLLTVSAAVALGVYALPTVGAFLGACLGAVFLRDALSESETALPALLWLNTGTMTGFAVGVLVSGMPVLVALGVSG